MYVDLYFIANLTLDYMLLYLMNRILECQAPWPRLLLGAAAGAAGATLWWWIRRGATGTLLDFFVVLLLAATMITLSWGRRSRREWWIRLAWLFGLSVLLEGIVRLCRLWLRDGTPMILVFALAAAVFAAAGLGVCSYYHFSGRGGKVGEVSCTVQGKTIRFYGWLDSGNMLRDPVGRRPVIIVEEEALKGLSLPETIPIPYRSVGNEGKVLWGFCPDKLLLRLKNQEKEVSAIVAGIAQPIRIHGCRAILPGQWCDAEKE